MLCFVFRNITDNSTRTKPGVLVATPFTNFSTATGKDGILTSDKKLQYHKDAMMAGSEFKGCLNNPEQTVPFIISASNQSQYEINIHILRSIVDTVLLCRSRITVFVAIETLFLMTL